MRTFGRILYRLIRIGVFIIPVLYVGMMGYGYLRQCLNVLAAPNAGVDFTYQARKGAVLHVTAQSYSYLWDSGTLHVIRPMLEDVNGDLLATADSARLTGLKPTGITSISAVVRNLRGRLVRLKNGHFALEEYLPEQTPQTQNKPYHVLVQNAQIVYDDLSGSAPFEQQASSKQMTVDGLGQDWIASGQLAMPGIGLTDAAVQRYKDSGLLISLNAQQLDLTRAVDHFRTTPEGRQIHVLNTIHAGRLVASGPVRIFLPENKPWLLSASIRAKGSDVLYGTSDRFPAASFDGLVTGTGASGTLTVERPGGSARFVGATDWSNGERFAGDITATVGNRSDIPPSIAKSIPSDWQFAGASGNGWLSYGAKDGFRYDGTLQAKSVRLAGQSVSSVNGTVRAGNGLVRIENAAGVWQGSPLTGSLAYYPTGQKVQGEVVGSVVQLASLAKSAHIQGLSGIGNADALIEGTSKAPSMTLRASGQIAFRATGASKAIAGSFEAAGSFVNGGLDVSSLSVDTPTGTAVATGHADLHGKVTMNVAVRGITLAAFAPSIGGLGSFGGQVTGTTGDPTLKGRAEIEGLTLQGHQIPLAVADLQLNKNLVSATNFQAIRGAAQATGSLTYGWNGGSLNGAFKAANVPLSPFSGQLDGIVDIPSATVGGTVKSPVVKASLESHGLVVANRHIGRGRATFVLNGDRFEVPELRADFAGGTVAASASGNIKTQQTRIQLSAKDVSLSDVAPQLDQTASLEGKVAGIAVLNTVGTDVKSARASGQLTDVVFNQTTVGSGSWSAAVTPQGFSGSAQVGTLERYLDLENLVVDRKIKTVSADLTAFHIPFSDVYSAVQRYIPPPSSDLEQRLLRINGIADAQASVSGQLSQPNVKVNTLTLSALNLEGRELGQLTAQFAKTGPIWQVANLAWQGPAGVLNSSGAINENGDINYQGDFTNVDLGLLSIVNDNLTRVSGRAALSFAVSGPTSNPTIQASLDASRTTVATSKDPTAQMLEFGMVLDTVNVSQSTEKPDGTLAGGIEASGKLFYRGLEGNLAAQIPLKYPLSLPQGQPLSVTLDLPPRELQTLSDYLPGLDAKRTQGTVSGHIGLGGRIGSALLTGNVSAAASTLAVNKVQTTLQNVKAAATVDAQNVSLNFDATSSEGGTVASHVTSPIGDVSDRIKELSSRGLDALLDRPVDGALTLSDFGIHYDAGPSGRLIAKANASVTASGPLRSPAVDGKASLSGVNTLLPSWDVTASGPPEYPIDPRFNVALKLNDTAAVSTSLARLRMIGAGTLTGTLNSPAVSSNMTVMGGTINLPTAAVRIDPGGTVDLHYQTGSNGDTLASLNVDMTGRTSLTTAVFGDVPQHYDITLTIRGNLLEEGQTFITAESDPPGLSQDRILALLGQADLIAAIAGGVTSMQANTELRNALAGYAVPALLSPLTNAFAKGLGLDYLTVAYDPYSQVSLSFSKEIGRNFSLQGMRQVSQPLPGVKPQFDLRLVYRLPFRTKTLRRTSIMLGLDQDRPWKVGVQYGFRF